MDLFIPLYAQLHFTTRENVEFWPEAKTKSVGAHSICARQQADDLRAHIECAPTEAENF